MEKCGIKIINMEVDLSKSERARKSKFYRIFPHTADLGVEVYGANLLELFEHSALALFDLMTNVAKVMEQETCEFSVEAADRELLLREWLGELLYYSISRHFLFKSCQIEQFCEQKLIASASGEPFNPQKHILKREIKSVTYHELQIRRQGNHWKARFVLDI